MEVTGSSCYAEMAQEIFDIFNVNPFFKQVGGKHILVDYIGVLKDGVDASVARRSPSTPVVNF